MAERGRGAVLNLASLIAFQPVPFQATYGATKAFVLSFTDALHEEMRGTGVTVTAVCPGPVRTEFGEAGGFGGADERIPGAAVARGRARSPRDALEAVERGDRVTVPGAGQPDRRAVGPAPAALGAAAARAAALAGQLGRLRPRRSWALTHSSATIAEPSDSSPHSTVAATISANLRTLPLP